MKLLLSFSALLLLEAVNAAPESLPVEDDTSKALSGDGRDNNKTSPTLHKKPSGKRKNAPGETDIEGVPGYDDIFAEYGDPDVNVIRVVDNDYVLQEADSEKNDTCRERILKLMDENYRLRNDLLFLHSIKGMLPLPGMSGTSPDESDSAGADAKIDESDSAGADTKIDESGSAGTKTKIDESGSAGTKTKIEESGSAGTKTKIDESGSQKEDTYEVHIMNGTRVEVNTTTTRNESADGTETVYHTKVIDIQPEGDMQNNTIIQITEIIKSGSSTIEEIPTLGTKEEDKSTLSTKSEEVQQNEESSSSVTSTDNGFKIHLN